MNFAADNNKVAVIKNATKRGWYPVSSTENWNFYWASVPSARWIFSPENNIRLTDHQIINHYPNSHEISRKDLMVKNLKRYRKEFLKTSDFVDKDVVKLLSSVDFLPTTFILPADYNMFLAEFKKHPSNKWIIKPCNKAQGFGIFLIDKLSQLKKVCKDFKECSTLMKENYVISRYIDNPLLIGGCKFDLRMYVLVTSFKPLKVYLYEQGFCRFCTFKYDSNRNEIGNVFVHLTNVAIQRQGEFYNDIHGGKWSVQNLKLYLEGTRGKKITDSLFNKIDEIILHTLFSVSDIMVSDKHCFECYGYDIIIDENMKPWLLEINASPSMNATTTNDCVMKQNLVNDIITLVLPNSSDLPDVHWNKVPLKDDQNDFRLLIDEDLASCEVMDEKSESLMSLKQEVSGKMKLHNQMKREKGSTKTRWR